MPRLTPEELATRNEGLGATDVVEACGLAPWVGAGPMRLFLVKTGSAPEDELDPVKLSYLEWGHAMESTLLDWYEKETGSKLIPGGHVKHREIEFLWATLDATSPDVIVEAKHVGPMFAHHWSEADEDGVPKYVRAQCIMGQACLGRRLTDVVASVGGRPPHVWRVAWDEELADLLVRGAVDFWRRVRRGEAPPLDATPATKEYLRRKWPSNEDRVVLPSTPDIDDIAARRIEAAIEEKNAEARKILADHELIDRIGVHDGIRGEGWSMSFRVNKKTGKRQQRFTAAALREEG